MNCKRSFEALGTFQNAPLIGSKCCINYNPTLDLRQLGYPILKKPTYKLLESFVLHDMDANDPYMLRRISQTWDMFNRKGSGWDAKIALQKSLIDNGLIIDLMKSIFHSFLNLQANKSHQS